MIFLKTLIDYNIKEVRVNKLVYTDTYESKSCFNWQDLVFIGVNIKKLKDQNLELEVVEQKIAEIINTVKTFDIIYKYSRLESRLTNYRPESSHQAKLQQGQVIKTDYEDSWSVMGYSRNTFSIIVPIEELERIVYQLYTKNYFTLENIKVFSNNISNGGFQISSNNIRKHIHSSSYRFILNYWLDREIELTSYLPNFIHTEAYTKRILQDSKKLLQEKFDLNKDISKLTISSKPSRKAIIKAPPTILEASGSGSNTYSELSLERLERAIRDITTASNLSLPF